MMRKMTIRNCATCQVSADLQFDECQKCTGPDWPNWTDGSEEPDTLVDAYAKINGLQQQVDAVYKAYCGRDLMHLPLVDAVGKVIAELRGFDEARADVIGQNGNDGLHYDADNSAPGFLRRATEIMDERGKTYDQDGGERSMGKTVQAFNAITGHTLSEAEGWLLLQVLKDVRQWQHPAFHQDSADDGVAYSALKAEALSRA
jgi:hypothetical protein